MSDIPSLSELQQFSRRLLPSDSEVSQCFSSDTYEPLSSGQWASLLYAFSDYRTRLAETSWSANDFLSSLPTDASPSHSVYLEEACKATLLSLRQQTTSDTQLPTVRPLSLLSKEDLLHQRQVQLRAASHTLNPIVNPTPSFLQPQTRPQATPTLAPPLPLTCTVTASTPFPPEVSHSTVVEAIASLSTTPATHLHASRSLPPRHLPFVPSFRKEAGAQQYFPESNSVRIQAITALTTPPFNAYRASAELGTTAPQPHGDLSPDRGHIAHVSVSSQRSDIQPVERGWGEGKASTQYQQSIKQDLSVAVAPLPEEQNVAVRSPSVVESSSPPGVQANTTSGVPAPPYNRLASSACIEHSRLPEPLVGGGEDEPASPLCLLPFAAHTDSVLEPHLPSGTGQYLGESPAFPLSHLSSLREVAGKASSPARQPTDSDENAHSSNGYRHSPAQQQRHESPKSVDPIEPSSHFTLCTENDPINHEPPSPNASSKQRTGTSTMKLPSPDSGKNSAHSFARNLHSHTEQFPELLQRSESPESVHTNDPTELLLIPLCTESDTIDHKPPSPDTSEAQHTRAIIKLQSPEEADRTLKIASAEEEPAREQKKTIVNRSLLVHNPPDSDWVALPFPNRMPFPNLPAAAGARNAPGIERAGTTRSVRGNSLPSAPGTVANRFPLQPLQREHTSDPEGVPSRDDTLATGPSSPAAGDIGVPAVTSAAEAAIAPQKRKREGSVQSREPGAQALHPRISPMDPDPLCMDHERRMPSINVDIRMNREAAGTSHRVVAPESDSTAPPAARLNESSRDIASVSSTEAVCPLLPKRKRNRTAKEDDRSAPSTEGADPLLVKRKRDDTGVEHDHSVPSTAAVHGTFEYLPDTAYSTMPFMGDRPAESSVANRLGASSRGGTAASSTEEAIFSPSKRKRDDSEHDQGTHPTILGKLEHISCSTPPQAPSSSEVAPGKPPSDSIAAAAVGKASPQGSQVKLATGTSRGAVATKLLAPPDDPAERTRTPPFQTEPDPCLLVRERVAESSQRESQVKLTTGSSRGAVAPTLLSPPDDPAEGTRTPSFQTEPDPCLLAPRESQVKKTSSTSRATAAPGAMAVPGSAETAPESQGTISTGGSHAGTSGSLPFRGLFLARFRAFCRRRGLPHSSSVVKLLFLAEVWPENGHRAALKDMVLEGGSLVAVAERMETKFSDSVRPAGTEARDASAPCRSPGAPSSSCGCDGCRELAPTAVKSATAPAGDGSAIREGRPGDALAETERERARHPGEPAREREHRAQPGTLNGEDEIGKSRAAASGGEGREENSRGDRPVAGARERGQCDRTRGAGAAPRKEEAQSVVPGAGKREATDDGRRSGEPDGGADGAIRPAQAERCRRAAEGPEDTAREAALVFAVETAVIHCEQLALLGCRQAGKDPPASPSSSSAAASASASASASARGRAPPSDSDPTAGALALLASIAEVLLKAAGPALWPRVPALARPLLSVLRRAPPPPPSWGAAWAASSFAAEFHHRAATLAAFACVRALRQAPAPAFKREPVAAAAQPDLGPCLALLTRYLLDAAAGRRHSPLTGGNPYLVTGEDMLAWVASVSGAKREPAKSSSPLASDAQSTS